MKRYSPTPWALRNEMDVVSLSLHGYGPAEFPPRQPVPMYYGEPLEPHEMGFATCLFSCPPNRRPGHVNAPIDFAPRSGPLS